MGLARLFRMAATVFFVLTVRAAGAAPLTGQAVRQAMALAESLMLERGFSVSGYGQTTPPLADHVEPSHIYLQGNDGAFVDGRIYLNTDAIEACHSLILLHELVHDATVKFRLFRGVPNQSVHEAIEALADQITSAAAQEPYRPRCLPKRRFEFSTAELASLAAP